MPTFRYRDSPAYRPGAYGSYSDFDPGRSVRDDYDQRADSRGVLSAVRDAMPWSRVLPIWAGAAGGAGLGAMFSGGAAPAMSAASAAGGKAAGAATAAAGRLGTMSTLGRIFSSPGMNLGVNAGLSLLGLRSSNRAADQAREDTMTQYRESLALQRAQLEAETRNADLDREDARALNEAINELRRRELDAAEEERAYTRGLSERREAYLEPFRQNSVQAMRALNAMFGGQR